jgi:hypothetical protein
MPEETQQQTKVYAPMSVEQRDGNYGPFLRASFRKDKMLEFINKHANERGYVNLVISERKEVGKYGETHNVVLAKPQSEQPVKPF